MHFCCFNVPYPPKFNNNQLYVELNVLVRSRYLAYISTEQHGAQNRYATLSIVHLASACFCALPERMCMVLASAEEPRKNSVCIRNFEMRQMYRLTKGSFLDCLGVKTDINGSRAPKAREKNIWVILVKKMTKVAILSPLKTPLGRSGTLDARPGVLSPLRASFGVCIATASAQCKQTYAQKGAKVPPSLLPLRLANQTIAICWRLGFCHTETAYNK